MIGWLAAWAALLGGAPQDASFREDGVILVKGQPFFPVGFYHVSSAGDAAKRSADLQMIAAAGCNTVHAELSAEDVKFLDEAQAFGLRVLAKCADADALRAAIKAFKGKDSLLGWNLAEDADNGKFFSSELGGLRDEVKKEDPGRLTYLTCSDHGNCGKFLECADLVGLKSLPLPDSHLSGPANLFTAAQRASEEKPRPFWAVIQSWAPKDKRAPTPDEVRNMTYQALIQGARGILYYAYFDKDWDLKGHPTLWNGIRVLASEIQTLRPAILGGQFRKINPKTEDVFVGAWTHLTRNYLVVVNASDGPKKVMLPLPDDFEGKGTPQFRVPTRRLELDGVTFMGEMGPGEVHVYLFQKK